MPSLDMKGPYRLTPEAIERAITAIQPGTFAIGYVKENGAFVIRYVGRSGTDVRKAVREQQADPTSWFKWSPAVSDKAAFDKECKVYHDFGEDAVLENEGHPEPPRNSPWACPVCGAHW
jgi:hypothetical protein